MGKVVKTLFGGTDKSSLKAQQAANKETQGFIERQADLARGDVLALAPGAFQNRNIGTQAAFDVLGQTIPQQFSTFQQGNVGAQSALLAGLPQFQNAILGLPTDLSGLQPQTLQFDPSFAQQQVPNFIGPEALNQQQVPSLAPQTGFVGPRGGVGRNVAPAADFGGALSQSDIAALLAGVQRNFA